MTRCHFITSTAVLATVGCGAILAQGPSQFVERIPHLAVGSHSYDSYAIALGDVDGDQDLDMLVGNQGPAASIVTLARDRLYLNDGNGKFRDVTEERLPPLTWETSRVQFVDYDGDGDLDIATGDSLAILTNDGKGFFTRDSDITLYGSGDICVADFDQDGHSDLAYFRTSNYPRRFTLTKGDGAGHFTEVAEAFPAEARSVGCLVSGDVDGDGDIDLIMGGYSVSYTPQMKILWRNDGSGQFVADPRWIAPSRDESTRQMLLVDLDGDGDDDLVSANYQKPDSVFENVGGMFVPFLADGLPLDDALTTGVAAGDFDADGDLDLCFTVEDAVDRLFLNDGTGFFSQSISPEFAPAARISRAIAAGDLDGDGHLDLALANPGRNEIWFNDGEGRLLPGLQGDLPSSFEEIDWYVASGDIDGDGDRDLLLSSFEQNIRIWWNDGHGRLEDLGERLEISSSSRAPQLADIDGDGDLDLLVLGLADAVWLRNPGDGKFDVSKPEPVPGLSYNIYNVEFADLTGDGAVDMIAANGDYRGTWGLYVNDGTGTFSRRAGVFDGGGSSYVRDLYPAIGDIDGDGDLDVAIGAFGNYAKLFVNDGSANFSDESLTRLPSTDRGEGASFGDIDGDGDLDLVMGKIHNNAGLYKNDGSGVFTEWDGLLSNSSLRGKLQLADVDLDGDPDLLAADTSDGAVLLINDGGGRFSKQGRLPAPLRDYRFFELADYDRDGDPDLLLNHYGATPLLLRNLHRQVVADAEVKIGSEHRAKVWSEPGYAQEPGIALLAIGLEIAPAPIHLWLYGNWWLAPENLQILGPVLHSPALAPAEFSLQIPAIPAGIGRTLYHQAAVMGASGKHPARFTNADQSPVRR